MNLKVDTAAIHPAMLKTSRFSGQEFYKLRDKEHDNPTIGLILCKSKNNQVAEYALGGMTRPIGVASFDLPPAMKQALAVEEIKQHLIDLDIGQKIDK